MKKRTVNTLVMVIMLALVGGFVSFLSTMYDFASSGDMLYNRFLTEHAKQVSVTVKTNDIAPGDTIKSIDFSQFGDNYCIYKALTNTPNKESASVRGVYSRGDVPIPPILRGRYFTREELEGDKPLAVVGKFIFDTLTPNEEGEYTYSLAGTEFSVIGCVGTEYDTNVNNLILYNLNAMMKLTPAEGMYFVDAKTEQNSRDVTDAFLSFWAYDESVNGVFNASYVIPEHSSAFFKNDLNRFILLSAALILLNIVMVCSQYTDDMKYTMAVKKMLGVSAFRAVGENLLRFFALATAGFAGGFFIVLPLLYRLLDSVYRNVYLQINYMNVLIAYGITLVYFAAVTVPFVVKIYFVDTSSELKGKE